MRQIFDPRGAVNGLKEEPLSRGAPDVLPLQHFDRKISEQGFREILQNLLADLPQARVAGESSPLIANGAPQTRDWFYG
jgi:hypothetical protein